MGLFCDDAYVYHHDLLSETHNMDFDKAVEYIKRGKLVILVCHAGDNMYLLTTCEYSPKYGDNPAEDERIIFIIGTGACLIMYRHGTAMVEE